MIKKNSLFFTTLVEQRVMVMMMMMNSYFCEKGGICFNISFFFFSSHLISHFYWCCFFWYFFLLVEAKRVIVFFLSFFCSNHFVSSHLVYLMSFLVKALSYLQRRKGLEKKGTKSFTSYLVGLKEKYWMIDNKPCIYLYIYIFKKKKWFSPNNMMASCLYSFLFSLLSYLLL